MKNTFLAVSMSVGLFLQRVNDLLPKVVRVLLEYPRVGILYPRRLSRSISLLFKEGVYASFQDAYDYLQYADVLHVRAHNATALSRIIFPNYVHPLHFLFEEHPLVSIIVCCHNRWEYTHLCLRAIQSYSYAIPYELIVVDDASTDDTALQLSKISNITVHTHTESGGYLQSINEGAALARGVYLVLLNNDTVPQPDWLRPLVEVLQNNTEATIVGPLLLFPDGRIQEAGSRILPDCRGSQYGRGESPFVDEFHSARQVDYVSGAVLCVRKDFWLACGGYDARFTPAYYEDADLCMQALVQEKKVFYQPRSTVMHWEHASYGVTGVRSLRARIEHNRSVFKKKWFEHLPSFMRKNQLHIFGNEARRSAQVILVLDRSVPRPGEDAGSRFTYQYLQLLVSLGCLVKFSPQQYRCIDLTEQTIEKCGIELIHPQHLESWMQMYGKEVDTVLCFRASVMADVGARIYQYTSARFLLCMTDIESLREERQRTYRSEIHSGSVVRAHTDEKTAYALSHGIFVLSEYERSLLSQRCTVPVSLLPIFIAPVSTLVRSDPGQSILFVAGFQHAPNHDALQWLIEILGPRARARIPSLRITVAGSFIPLSISSQHPEISFVHFPDDSMLKELYQHATVVLVPLRIGAGVKGKIAEAFIFGVPVVTTSIGREGFPGTPPCLIGDTEDELIDALVRIISDPSLAESLRSLGRDYVRIQFSSHTALTALRTLIPELPTTMHTVPHIQYGICDECTIHDPKLLTGPLVSIVMPAWHSQAQFLQEALQSVRNQEYQHWELCIAYADLDASAQEVLERMAVTDARIRIFPQEKNLGISGNTNAAIQEAEGTVIAFMDHDDLLMPTALSEVLRAMQTNEADLVYSDEYIVFEDGSLKQVVHKPGWSPEAFRSANYIGHFVAVRSDIVRESGGLRSLYDGAQDHDFLFRVTKKAKNITHIPLLLYVWRAHKKSTSFAVSVKPYVPQALIRSVSDDIIRMGDHADVSLHSVETCRVVIRYHIKARPKVDIIIPSRNEKLLSRCLESLNDVTSYPEYSCTLISHQNQEIKKNVPIPSRASRIIEEGGDFNFSSFCNRAVHRSTGEYILLLNDDILITEPDWLTALLEPLQQKRNGITGARLWYPDNRVQHFGVVMGLGPDMIAYNAYRGTRRAEAETEHLLNVPREFLAVTGACLLTTRALWDHLNGMNESLPLAYNDVDFCLRAREQGSSIIATPYANVIHYESMTRSFGASPKSIHYMRRRWNTYLTHDPYLTPEAIRYGPYDTV